MRIRPALSDTASSLMLILGLSLLLASASACTSFPRVQRTIARSSLPLTLKWDYDAGAPIRRQPGVVGNLVLIKTDTLIIALDAQTGKKVWEASARTDDLPPDPFRWHSEVLAFTSDFRINVNAVSLRNGKLIWSQSWENVFDGQISEIALDDKAVYVARGRPTKIRAHRLEDGTVIWNSESLDASAWKLSVKDNQLLVFNGADLHILDTETGIVTKNVKRKFVADLSQYTVVAESDVYQSNYGTTLARSVDTGEVRWQVMGTLRFFTVIDNLVYASSEQGNFVAIDKVNGRVSWRQRFEPESVSYAVRIGNVGYVMLHNGVILGFDLDAGTEVGRIETNTSLVSPFLYGQGLDTNGEMLFATFGDNKLFAFAK